MIKDILTKWIQNILIKNFILTKAFIITEGFLYIMQLGDIEKLTQYKSKGKKGFQISSFHVSALPGEVQILSILEFLTETCSYLKICSLGSIGIKIF